MIHLYLGDDGLYRGWYFIPSLNRYVFDDIGRKINAVVLLQLRKLS